MRRAKLKQVVSAVHQLRTSRGVTQTDVQGLLRETYGHGASLDCKPALRAAVNEGFLAIKNRRFFPTTATDTFLELRRRGRSRSKKRRGRRGGSRKRSSSRRRSRRGRKRVAFSYIIEARRRRKRPSSRRTRRKHRKGRRVPTDIKQYDGVERGANQGEEPAVKQEEGSAQ